jgi:hypothetical protein
MYLSEQSRVEHRDAKWQGLYERNPTICKFACNHAFFLHGLPYSSIQNRYIFSCFSYLKFILISVALFNCLHSSSPLKAHICTNYLKTDMKVVLLLSRQGSLRCRDIIVSSANISELINIQTVDKYRILTLIFESQICRHHHWLGYWEIVSYLGCNRDFLSFLKRQGRPWCPATLLHSTIL